MSTDEYVPSERAVRRAYTYYYDPATIRRPDAEQEFDRFLARVRRDAYEWGRYDERMSLAYAPPASDGRPGHYPEEDQA